MALKTLTQPELSSTNGMNTPYVRGLNTTMVVVCKVDMLKPLSSGLVVSIPGNGSFVGKYMAVAFRPLVMDSSRVIKYVGAPTNYAMQPENYILPVYAKISYDFPVGTYYVGYALTTTDINNNDSDPFLYQYPNVSIPNIAGKISDNVVSIDHSTNSIAFATQSNPNPGALLTPSGSITTSIGLQFSVGYDAAPTVPSYLTASGTFKPGGTVNLSWGTSTSPTGSPVTYQVHYSNNNSTWNATGIDIPKNSESWVIPSNFTGSTIYFRVFARGDDVSSDYRISNSYAVTINNTPTVSLTSPSASMTLYENDNLNISGTAYDADKDQSVTAYYQINSETKKVLATNLSQTQISLSKQLIFKGGKLNDGDSAFSGTLVEGAEHKLKVWAVDSEGAQSTTVERSFYVVPNRAPLLSVDTVVPSGTIGADNFTISGTATDPDANSIVTVSYQINSAKAVEIYSGTDGEWRFEVLLEQLQVGENQILIEVIDNYGAKTKKKVTLNKNEINTPVLKSVARYKIEPPQGTAKGILFWIQRDERLIVNTEISMTSKNEPEEFVVLTPTNTETVRQGIVEDEFYYETEEAKENIILKVQMTRLNANVDNKIYLISGVFD
ncbi:hypothetical protein [Lysinibacillus xylanilyticus]|uniref:Fibronectin type-III domain-containing protein n=1 Tax=Lysinibacillus xylanilyticus TaxID=582475 RepID=A0ABT4EMD7_9BACI|nr:hypothetical protein [Lysinibacillus xylanilyticus]MCY9546824.1 hypothetical protein [Lysinibacillus xylanilyticus]